MSGSDALFSPNPDNQSVAHKSAGGRTRKGGERTLLKRVFFSSPSLSLSSFYLINKCQTVLLRKSLTFTVISSTFFFPATSFPLPTPPPHPTLSPGHSAAGLKELAQPPCYLLRHPVRDCTLFLSPTHAQSAAQGLSASRGGSGLYRDRGT